MTPEEKKKQEESKEELGQFEITFKNGALDNLERLATRFGISPEEDLNKVVAKAIRLLTIVKDAKDSKVRFRDKNGDDFFIDINNL